MPPPVLSPLLASSIFRNAREPGWDKPVEGEDNLLLVVPRITELNDNRDRPGEGARVPARGV